MLITYILKAKSRRNVKIRINKSFFVPLQYLKEVMKVYLLFNQSGARRNAHQIYLVLITTDDMTKNNKSVNTEKNGRAVRETNRESFSASVTAMVALVSAPEFMDAVCKRTDNGKYKVTDTKPTDMDKVKTFESDGVKWYLVPTTDDKTAIATYIRYRLNKEKVANNNLNKEFANLTLEQKKALLEMLNK